MSKNQVISKPKAIIFDWDNTLVDSWVVIHDALNATFGEFSMAPWTIDETRERVGVSLREGFPVLFGDDWERARDVFYRHFEAIHLDRLTPMPGAAEALEGLRELGFYMAVLSNKTGYLLRRETEHLGWDGYFSKVIGAQDASRDKPAPEPMVLALDGAPQGIEAMPGTNKRPHVWYVGDAAIDVECAHNAGCRAVLVGNGAEAGEKGFDNTVLRLDSLLALHNLARKL